MWTLVLKCRLASVEQVDRWARPPIRGWKLEQIVRVRAEKSIIGRLGKRLTTPFRLVEFELASPKNQGKLFLCTFLTIIYFDSLNLVCVVGSMSPEKRARNPGSRLAESLRRALKEQRKAEPRIGDGGGKATWLQYHAQLETCGLLQKQSDEIKELGKKNEDSDLLIAKLRSVVNLEKKKVGDAKSELKSMAKKHAKDFGVIQEQEDKLISEMAELRSTKDKVIKEFKSSEEFERLKSTCMKALSSTYVVVGQKLEGGSC
ncbi:uncharacterized protein Pyn_16086 [Prunus yedoensis var. nudiflora]|uniref:Uncharacterized protein n=1 Tax=Prunus yedoensis var. nudiflora TaxID=2094558 RepID=A0A314YXA3_PRUYE|nr:uncharacterized protein Pyn_16086 [Prunus yedoensis var. nudiflora]